MINRIMKESGNKAYVRDLERLDRTSLSEEITTLADISYIDDGSPEHTLDIYYLDDGIAKPVLIDIHGGGFISHDKKVDIAFGNVMAQNGFVVFSLNYRLAYPEFNVFDQIEDIDKATHWIVENAASYGGDIERMYLAGHSSGAVNAVAEALLSLSPSMLSDYGLEQRGYQYSGLILDCGLLFFYKNSIAYNGMRRMVFPKGYRNDKRYKYLLFDGNEDIGKLPKTAVITNESDELKTMSFNFDGLLKDKGVEHILFTDGSQGHMGMIFEPKACDMKLISELSEYLKG